MAVSDRPDPRAAICSEVDADAGASPPRFEIVQSIFDDNCVSCHAVGADLDLDRGVAWSNLVGKPAPAVEACGGTLVVPGDPTASYLYQKLSSAHPCAGDQMPRTEFGSSPLPDCVVGLVRQWIASGAPAPGTDASAD